MNPNETPTPRTAQLEAQVRLGQADVYQLLKDYESLERELIASNDRVECHKQAIELIRTERDSLRQQLEDKTKECSHFRQELALAKIPTTVDAVEREEWRQERNQLKLAAEKMVEALGLCLTTLEFCSHLRKQHPFSIPDWGALDSVVLSRQIEKSNQALTLACSMGVGKNK